MPSEARSATPVPAEEGAAGGAKSSASAADEGGRGGPTAPIARSAASALWLGSFFAETRCSRGAGCSRGWERYPVSGFFFWGGGGSGEFELEFFFCSRRRRCTHNETCLSLSLSSHPLGSSVAIRSASRPWRSLPRRGRARAGCEKRPFSVLLLSWRKWREGERREERNKIVSHRSSPSSFSFSSSSVFQLHQPLCLSPSTTISATLLPDSGPLRIPQHEWPPQTYRFSVPRTLLITGRPPLPGGGKGR